MAPHDANESTARPTGAVVLEVGHLSCVIDTPRGQATVVDDVSFELARGRTLGIVGESGSGKSLLVRSIVGIGPITSTVTGRALLNGVDLVALSKQDRRAHLGRGIGMVFQNPMTALNPVVPIGRQITEGVRHHQRLGRSDATAAAGELLLQVGISDPERILGSYPHELSGGMKQRVTIAAALACDPEVLIADEATTALDVTVQRQILDLLGEIQAARNMALILISHDLGVVAGRTDEVAVMYAGQIVEMAPTLELFDAHRHRYTESLLEAVPRLTDRPHDTFSTIPGTPPDPLSLPPGCRFQPRCSAADDACQTSRIEFVPPNGDRPAGHRFRCVHPSPSHRALELARPDDLAIGGER